MSAGEYDAIVLAEAGLTRLGIRIQGERFPPEKFVPSPNQGTIAVVSRADPSLMEVLSALDHPQTRTDVAIERAVMEQLGRGMFHASRHLLPGRAPHSRGPLAGRAADGTDRDGYQNHRTGP